MSSRDLYENTEYIERLISINRVTKVVRGGRRFGFSALVVIGDGNGKIGFSIGKAREVQDAIRKAINGARKSLVYIQLRKGRTFYHEISARVGSGKVYIRPARPGTGVIAGGPMRAIFEVLGIKDVVSKSIGTRTAHNVVRATIKALLDATSPSQNALKRRKIGFSL